MNDWLRTLCLLVWLAMAGPMAWAADAKPLAEDPVLEARVNGLAEELRCLVCQNQTIADSHAGLAVDLKNQIREQLKAGRTEQQVRDFMVERFGDFVLYSPPVKASTVLLWVGPFVLLLVAGWALRQAMRRQRAAVAAVSDDVDQRARAAALLDNKG
ncbi:cytochrome c-type biogenesis protein [Ideonella sp. A 288]|uniref:cytochrome c-type biogenesis protein n=1 Tax=Ideonella sp. A 288 TaxID=1962181 RepID=UPI000B4A6045|nr:cytochrome c-type biogenesis protein [Ideonella sp. A 288]